MMGVNKCMRLWRVSKMLDSRMVFYKIKHLNINMSIMFSLIQERF